MKNSKYSTLLPSQTEKVFYMTSLQGHRLKAKFMSVAQFDAKLYDISGWNELTELPDCKS